MNLISKHKLISVGTAIFVLLNIILASWLVLVDRQTNVADNTSENLKLEAATDPNFPEIKGEIIAGFPQFPVYPGSTLVASAKTNTDEQPDNGYRVKWVTKDSVIKVMQWYEAELLKVGWQYIPPNDPQAKGEQVAEISNNEFKGYIAAEVEEGIIEIVVDVRIVK